MNEKTFKIQESKRVAAARKQKIAEGYKNISFMVTPKEYEMIERQRRRLGLTNKELFFYYLLGQDQKEIGGHEQFDPHYDLKKLKQLSEQERTLFLLQQAQKQGEAFAFKPTTEREHAYKDFLIAEFLYVPVQENRVLTYFPYQISTPNKGYHSRQEAMQAYVQKKPLLHKRR